MTGEAQAKKANRPKRNRQKATQGITYIAFVLDKSGSMEIVRDATISGFNEYIQDRKNDKDVDYRFSLTMFDTHYNKVYTTAKIGNVNPLSRESYVPNGMTALYDAVANTMSDISQQIGPNDRVLFVMMTDGQENSSREATLAQVRESISQKEKAGNWTFVYLGANQDAWAVGHGLGLSSRNNTLTYGHSAVGTQSAMESLSRSTVSYAASAKSATMDFFAPEDQEKQDQLGANQNLNVGGFGGSSGASLSGTANPARVRKAVAAAN